MDNLTPKDHAEAVALFRSEIVGALTRIDLPRGALAEKLEALSQQRFRPPGATATRTFAVPTLERWYRLYKKGGLAALRPEPRSDRGVARALTPEQQDLLCDVRRERPSASAELILDTLVADGRLHADVLSPSSLRRLFAARGLDKRTLRNGIDGKQRLRWEASHPGALWHGDVCHGAHLLIGGEKKPVRIHGMLDDASRYVVALEAMHQEREVDMLGLLVRAVRKHGPPDAIYLDNGSTYRGYTLALACARMGTTLLHAKPYDAPARGKMERFWRTLRERCLDFAGSLGSLHDLNVRLCAFLDEHYHRTPHGALMGKAPETVFTAAARPDDFDETKLRNALTVHVRRRVRGDSTVPMDGEDWETDQGFLARRLVTVSRCMVDPAEPPWIEHEGVRHVLCPVDPRKNAHRKRAPLCLDTPHEARTPFDPPKALLDKSLGRAPTLPGSKEET
jgi:transposase InsO family protein